MSASYPINPACASGRALRALEREVMKDIWKRGGRSRTLAPDREIVQVAGLI